MMALGGVTAIDKIGELLPAVAADPEGWLQQARDDLPDKVMKLYAYWAEGRRAGAERLAQRAQPVRREVSKVGRNAPCPCGSGKKSKKCCAN